MHDAQGHDSVRAWLPCLCMSQLGGIMCIDLAETRTQMAPNLRHCSHPHPPTWCLLAYVCPAVCLPAVAAPSELPAPLLLAASTSGLTSVTHGDTSLLWSSGYCLESLLLPADLSLLSGHTGLPAGSQTHQGNSYARTFVPDILSAKDPPR